MGLQIQPLVEMRHEEGAAAGPIERRRNTIGAEAIGIRLDHDSIGDGGTDPLRQQPVISGDCGEINGRHRARMARARPPCPKCQHHQSRHE
jgi:hypothetical protein